MSPAFEAATATMVPTVSTAARAPGSVQPAAAKTAATPSSVTSVIPENGLRGDPDNPDDPRGHRHEKDAEYADARRTHRPLQWVHVAGETLGTNPSHDDHDTMPQSRSRRAGRDRFGPAPAPPTRRCRALSKSCGRWQGNCAGHGQAIRAAPR